jgi:hypothetical protein
MPDDLGISSMHLSGKLFQMIDNKNKTMIVEMKAPSVIPSLCFFHQLDKTSAEFHSDLEKRLLS